MATYNIDSLPSSLKEGDIINCPYSGTIKSIVLSKGTYKFELWGAGVDSALEGTIDESPDSAIGSGITGYKMGGYTVGNFTVSDSSKTLYLVSGGAGTPANYSGYNGGGIHRLLNYDNQNLFHTVGRTTNGGGATHIALVSGLLSEIGEDNISKIVAVAGGSGGPAIKLTANDAFPLMIAFGADSGAGGGSEGLPKSNTFQGGGGTQTRGGYAGHFLQNLFAGDGSFGQGGDGVKDTALSYTSPSFNTTVRQYASGGGGGLYGGGGGCPVFQSGNIIVGLAQGGGGSGYISDALEDAATYNPDDNTPACPDKFNGYIRITLLSTAVKNVRAKVNGTWEDCTPMVKVNNTWKNIDKLFVKVNGVWQPVIN